MEKQGGVLSQPTRVTECNAADQAGCMYDDLRRRTHRLQNETGIGRWKTQITITKGRSPHWQMLHTGRNVNASRAKKADAPFPSKDFCRTTGNESDTVGIRR
jgi:hypothetical protein